MKKAMKTRRGPDMLDKYDFSKGVRGKYAKRYTAGSNVVVLSHPMWRQFFPTLSQ
jgi:capsule polysaccharide modification protein KpsS